MRNIVAYTMLLVLCLLEPISTPSQNIIQDMPVDPKEESLILLRPNTNIGFLDNEFAYSVGLRVLLKAGENKSYGLEMSRFDAGQSDQSIFTAGIMLEQKLFDWFNMSMGTIGYFNLPDESKSVVGISSNLGWEPNSKKRISPFVTYRSDFIIGSKLYLINSLNLGFNVKFNKAIKH